jgi:hypothetical protein
MSRRTALTAFIAAGVLVIAVPTYAASGPDRGSSSAKPTATPTPTTARPSATPTPVATPTPGAARTATPGPADMPKPVPGESVAGTPAAGTVEVRTPDGKVVDIADAAEIPVGSVIDTTGGAIVLTIARADGGTESATFSGGVFEIRQNARTGYTDMYLRGGSFARCRTATRALASISRSKPKPVRRLWGSDDGGRFRTHGRNSVATVRGTRWLTEDRCNGTLTSVTKGKVAVFDFGRDKRITVKSGQSYLARATRAAIRKLGTK